MSFCQYTDKLCGLGKWTCCFLLSTSASTYNSTKTLFPICLINVSILKGSSSINKETTDNIVELASRVGATAFHVIKPSITENVSSDTYKSSPQNLLLSNPTDTDLYSTALLSNRSFSVGGYYNRGISRLFLIVTLQFQSASKKTSDAFSASTPFVTEDQARLYLIATASYVNSILEE